MWIEKAENKTTNNSQSNFSFSFRRFLLFLPIYYLPPQKIFVPFFLFLLLLLVSSFSERRSRRRGERCTLRTVRKREEKGERKKRRGERDSRECTTGSDRQRRNGETAWQLAGFWAISRAMLAINATLIYHALTYDVDGSRTSQDKTNRRNWRWQARELSLRSATCFRRPLFRPRDE